MTVELAGGQYRGIVEAIAKGIIVIKMGKLRIEYSEEAFNNQVEQKVQRGHWVVFTVEDKEIVSAGFSNPKLRNRL